MRVLHLLRTQTAQLWACRLIEQLSMNGVECHATLPNTQEGFGPRYRKAGVSLISANYAFPVVAPWTLPQAVRGLRTAVEQVKPDIIHAHDFRTMVIMRMALGKSSRIPRIFQVPGPLHLEHGLFRRWDAQTIGEQDHIVATSEYTRTLYRKAAIVPDRRLFLCHYGGDFSLNRAQRTGKLRRELNHNEQVPLVGMVAYIYPPKWYLGHTRGIKGHETFIEAIALCNEQTPVSGVIIGGCWQKGYWYERQLHRYAARVAPGRISFTGHRTDVIEIYPDLDIAVHPATSENLGGSCESLLAGVPTIASNAGGLPEIIRHKETGLLFEPADAKGLANAMLEMIAEPAHYKAITAASRQQILENLGAPRTTEVMQGIYSKILQ